MIANANSSSRRWVSSGRILAALAVLAILTNLAACWVTPWRMRYERGPIAGSSGSDGDLAPESPGGSYYTFAYIPDEIFYAQRVQPLLSGASALNVINGISDPQCVSQNFLEDALRAFVTAMGMDVITFVWAWRVLFPVALAMMFMLLARNCFLRVRRPWTRSLAVCGGAAAFAGVYFLYDMLVQPLPYHNWIDRFGANIDYPLSALIAALLIRFLRAPTLGAGASVAACGAALLYVRPFTALPWAIAIVLALTWLAVARDIAWRLYLLIGAIFALLIAPFCAVQIINGRSAYMAQYLGRCYPKVAYEVHASWKLHLFIAAGVLAAGFLVSRRYRVMLACGAAALAALPFLCALTPIAREMLRADRFGAYYNVLLLAAGLLLLKSWSDSWRGKFSLWQARRAAAACVAFSFSAAGLLAARNLQYDFTTQPTGHYDVLQADARYLDGYRWAAANTPPDALFLVDDGFDWSLVPPDPVRMVDRLLEHHDLFLIVARRRAVYTDWMTWHATSTEDLLKMITLQRGTFGFPVSNSEYRDLLKRFQPTYVFWRKFPPLRFPYAKGAIPRGKSETLKQLCTEVYSDDACAIWKIRYQ
jgi:hypothetical protein